MPLELLNTLNTEQQNAAKHYTGPALVLAGPGSGKTRVLTYRIAHLINEKKVYPSEIMAITFTNKAANEMKERLKLVIGDNAPSMVGTFHSICSRILRIDGIKIGIEKNFNIYDTTDSVNLIKNIMESLNMDSKKINPNTILAGIQSAKQELVSSKEYSKYAKGHNSEAINKIYGIYQSKLTELNSLDFGDLIFKTVELFENSSETLIKYNDKINFLLVDEYQDTNRSQYIISNLLSKKNKNIFVVGDMSQAIYSWRGADYRNIINFKNDYDNAVVYTLNQNYRSTKNIIEASKSVIKNNPNNINLDLWTSNSKGEKIKVYEALSEKEEAEYVANQIINSKHNYSEIGVLYRTNAQSRNIEEYLIKYGIPYKIYGGLRFYDRKEIKDIISYLKVINNPKDAIAWNRILNVPQRGIGKQTINKIADQNYNLDVISKYGLDLKPIIQIKESLTTLEIIEKILQVTKYIDYLKAQNEEKEKIAERIDNLKELTSVAKEYPNLLEFLQNTALMEEGVSNNNQANSENHGVINLMTLHSAKGLEFEQVFLVGMEEGIFPHSRSIESKEELEEERRLCYVGITRAKTNLHLSFAKKRMYFGTINHSNPSRFIFEIPQELTEGNFNVLNKTSSQNQEKLDDFFEDLGI